MAVRAIETAKHEQILEVKELFKKRIDIVVKAKNYELKCQKSTAIEAAKRIATKMNLDVRDLFNGEMKNFETQFSRMLRLIEFFEQVVNE